MNSKKDIKKIVRKNINEKVVDWDNLDTIQRLQIVDGAVKSCEETIKEYEGLYLKEKKEFECYRKHRHHDVNKCKWCKEWYRDSVKSLNKIKDKKLRQQLKELFKTLWINNDPDFDIIWYEFCGFLK